MSYGGENGFNQAIELSADALSNVKFIQEKRLIGIYTHTCTRVSPAIYTHTRVLPSYIYTHQGSSQLYIHIPGFSPTTRVLPNYIYTYQGSPQLYIHIPGFSPAIYIPSLIFEENTDFVLTFSFHLK